MKKILLATSLLAATTGFAAAEVTVSGDARMGIIYNGSDALFTSRARVKFSMVGTTDGGVEFGASFRANDAASSQTCTDPDAAGPLPLACTTDGKAVGNTAMTAGSVYISANGLKLSMGDNDSAANALVGNVSGVGLTGLGDVNELGYLGQTDTSVLVEYSTGAVTLALSSSQLNAGDEALSVAVKYSTDAFSVALGYEDTATDKHLALSGSATFGAATVKAVISDQDTVGDLGYALSVDYAAGAGTYTVFYADKGGSDRFGLGASYDLGGGASVVGGIVDNGTDTVADLGISMSF